ncbi:MAG TPA: citryl-CoA lyase [Phycisphaerales bacterium]|nr:citryl-CoA lyase [Phycisphaerales bacterium]
MSILIDKSSRVIVQGMTGREGQARTRLMLDYGTNVVGGVTPGKSGSEVFGLPVFNSCADAVQALGPIDISVLFVPAAGVKDAALDAIRAGVKLVVIVADRVPVWDAMEIAAEARDKGSRFVGPNTLGIASPGQAVVGMIGGRAESAREWFKPPLPGGTGVGIISRSGGMSSSTAYYLGQAEGGGVRISSIVHIGGDAVLGLRIPDVAQMFQDDPATDAIVVFGEIGGSQEEELADLIKAGKITKPVVAYIGGKAATAGTRFSHAGAIIEGNKGTHAGKVAALQDAGATVVGSFGELPDAVASMLRARASKSLMSDAERKAVWTTAVTRIEPNKVAVRGRDIASLMGNASFGAAVYLILTGRLPDERTGRLMDAILVSSIDHGATPPSCLAARTVASTGASLSQSVAAGIMSINRHHGGAIEDCARFLGSLLKAATEARKSIDQVAADEVARIKSTGDRISGFGHRIHTKDPRTARLFELAALAGLTEAPTTHIGAARAVERAFASIGKPLPINVDGAIGAILADLGLDPKVFNGIFMIARTPGLVAHVVEEQTREKPMRRIDPVNHAYDGPSGN